MIRACIFFLLFALYSCQSPDQEQRSDLEQSSAPEKPVPNIAKVYGELSLDTPPEELYGLFNQFCREYYGAERDPLIYEKFGDELEIKGNSGWNYVSERSACIAWETNLPASTCVEYEPGKGYKRRAGKRYKYRSGRPYKYRTGTGERHFYIHVHYLKGLKENTEYHYRLVSTDERGNRIESEDKTFTTRKIPNAIHIPGDLGNPPYILDQENAVYVVTRDIIAGRTAFDIAAEGITLDLGGNTVTHANELIYDLDYLSLDRAGVGIRRVDYGSRQSGLKILNGTIRQGAAGNNQDYTAARDMLRPDPERKKRLEKNSSRGFSNIEITTFSDVEIAGVTCEYHFPQTWGMRFESAFGKYDIHHNVIKDKGTQLFNRHGGGTVRSIGFRSGSGVYTSSYDLNNETNEVQIHHNLIKRTRHNALHIAQKIYNNEIYVDSWAVNSFAISPHKHGGQVYNNKVFLTGYYACGILWATSDLHVHNNFIHMENLQTMIERPLKGRRLIETWGEQDVVAGMRITNYGKGGQERENLSYTDNLIIGFGRGDTELRGTEFYSDYSIRNLICSNNVFKIEAEDTIFHMGACVDAQGAYNDRSTHLPLYYRNCSLISNICNVRFGDAYGQGSNHRFIQCRIMKTENNPKYHTFVFDGHSSVFNHVLLDCEFSGGASYNDVYWKDTQSLSNYRIAWTLDIETLPGARISIKDKSGKLKAEASADANGRYSIPLTQCIIRPTEWNPGGREVEVLNKWAYQEEDLSSYTVDVEAEGRHKSATVEMTESRELRLFFD